MGVCPVEQTSFLKECHTAVASLNFWIPPLLDRDELIDEAFVRIFQGDRGQKNFPKNRPELVSLVAKTARSIAGDWGRRKPIVDSLDNVLEAHLPADQTRPDARVTWREEQLAALEALENELQDRLAKLSLSAHDKTSITDLVCDVEIG